MTFQEPGEIYLNHANRFNNKTQCFSLKLVENGSPKLSCDQMEDWTTAEAGLFEEAMEKYGKVSKK